MARVLVAAAGAGLVAAIAWPARAAAQPAPPAAGPTVPTVVAGIVGYTRWPAEAPPLRLCTLGGGAAVDALLGGLPGGSPQRPVSVQPLAPGQAPGAACEAVYVGQAEAAQVRRLVRELAGRPVLTLGEGSEFCSDGGMFCLDGGARFAVNLDAIARSGLRVNPMVLRLARSAGAGS